MPRGESSSEDILIDMQSAPGVATSDDGAQRRRRKRTRRGDARAVEAAPADCADVHVSEIAVDLPDAKQLLPAEGHERGRRSAAGGERRRAAPRRGRARQQAAPAAETTGAAQEAAKEPVSVAGAGAVAAAGGGTDGGGAASVVDGGSDGGDTASTPATTGEPGNSEPDYPHVVVLEDAKHGWVKPVPHKQVHGTSRHMTTAFTWRITDQAKGRKKTKLFLVAGVAPGCSKASLAASAAAEEERKERANPFAKKKAKLRGGVYSFSTRKTTAARGLIPLFPRHGSLEMLISDVEPDGTRVVLDRKTANPYNDGLCYFNVPEFQLPGKYVVQIRANLSDAWTEETQIVGVAPAVIPACVTDPDFERLELIRRKLANRDDASDDDSDEGMDGAQEELAELLEEEDELQRLISRLDASAASYLDATYNRDLRVGTNSDSGRHARGGAGGSKQPSGPGAERSKAASASLEAAAESVADGEMPAHDTVVALAYALETSPAAVEAWFTHQCHRETRAARLQAAKEAVKMARRARRARKRHGDAWVAPRREKSESGWQGAKRRKPDAPHKLGDAVFIATRGKKLEKREREPAHGDAASRRRSSGPRPITRRLSRHKLWPHGALRARETVVDWWSRGMRLELADVISARLAERKAARSMQGVIA